MKAVFALGIISLVRLTYFKAELRKLFDPREGLTMVNSGVVVFRKILPCESMAKD